jgi:hypothetical protein
MVTGGFDLVLRILRSHRPLHSQGSVGDRLRLSSIGFYM